MDARTFVNTLANISLGLGLAIALLGMWLQNSDSAQLRALAGDTLSIAMLITLLLGLVCSVMTMFMKPTSVERNRGSEESERVRQSHGS